MASSNSIHATDVDECPNLSRSIPLGENEREIRLLRLCDDIKVEKYSLLLAPPYYAISYCWGPALPTQQIRVHGESIAVRESVSSVLEILREKYGDKALFWVDFICVDQRNLVERNMQVSMMNEIYSRAIEVISWLGHSNPQSQAAFQIIRKRLACPADSQVRFRCDSQHVDGPDDAHIDWPSITQLETDHDLSQKFAELVIWPSLADVLRRPYWRRMWVVQEMIVASKCTLLCGTDAISLDDLIAVGDLWITKAQHYRYSETNTRLEVVNTSRYQDIINTWVPISKISRVYRKQYKEDGILLMEIVDNFVSKECSNVRDKVFALRSLNKDAANIKVDYSRSVLEVFLSLVQCGLLTSDGNRGFQSLPNFIRCMNIDHDTLNEQLAELPRSVVSIYGRLNGIVVTTKEIKHILEDGEMGKYATAYIQLVYANQDQQEALYRSHKLDRAYRLLENALPGDMLCTVPQASPILLLLRPQRRERRYHLRCD